MHHRRVVLVAAWLSLAVYASAEAPRNRLQDLLTQPPLTISSSNSQEPWCPFKENLIAASEPRNPMFGLKSAADASQRLSLLPVCDARLPKRYDQHHAYEQLRVWESTNCYNPLRLNTSQHANRSQMKSSQQPRVRVLEELIAVIVIFGECMTLGACFVDWVVVQVPGFAFYAVHNVVGLVVGGITAAAHHLLFTGWYLQWFPESNIYLIAPMLQIVLSFSTGLLYASAMQQLAELHYERRRRILELRYPPPARSY